MNKIFKLFCGCLAFGAVSTMFTSCSDDNDPTYLDEVRVSSSYVAINQNGGSTTITVDASADWAFANQKWINGKDTIQAAAPQWLTLSTTSGSAGQTNITFSAESTLDGRTCELLLNCGGKVQRINVIQGLSTVSDVTCAEVIAGPDSKTYRVTGTVTAIANTTYGNWYLEDGTGSVYIYGTRDKNGSNGANNSIAAWGIEVGDEITVEGPKTTYNGTVELVDVTVVNINKSLIKVDSLSTSEDLPVEGGDVTAFITCKGSTGVSVVMPTDSWLSVVGLENQAGVYTVTLHANANEGGDRTMPLTFYTTDNSGKKYTTEISITQKGAIVAASIAEFNAAEVGSTQYRITGIITSVANASYGNYYIRDYSGETYVYGTGAKGDFEAMGLKAGDIVTIVGKRDQYKETIEMTGSTVENIISVNEVSIAEFLTKEDNPNVYYKVTGTVDEIANATYGNLYIKDGDARVYSYGCYPGWGATDDFRKNLLAEKDIAVGDELTIIGVKSTYNGTVQINGGLYYSHKKAE